MPFSNVSDTKDLGRKPRNVNVVVEARIGPAGKEILEGCPAGQKEAARKSLAEKSVPVITEALVTRVGLTEAQPASTSQPARKSITLKTAATDSRVCHPTPAMAPTINIPRPAS